MKFKLGTQGLDFSILLFKYHKIWILVCIVKICNDITYILNYTKIVGMQNKNRL